MDPNQNLFNPEFTQGDLSTIEFIRDWVGRIAVIIISLVGFGIVMASILKNALRGLYHVFPKFFDHVDEIKKSQIQLRGGDGQSGNRITMLLGTASSILLSFVPNVKALTDAEEEPIDAKTYFMRAIPMMCVQIFIGVFIFFGYPSRIAEKASMFGTQLFDMFLLNVDPIAWAEKLPEKYVNIDLATDGSEADADKGVNKMAKRAYTALVGVATDMSKQKRMLVAREVEGWVQSNSNDFAEYLNEDAYSMNIFARIEDSQPDNERVNNKHTNGIHQYSFYTLANSFSTGSPKVKDSQYLRVDVTFTDKASKDDTSKVECIAENVTFTKVEGANPKLTITFASSASSSGKVTARSSVNSDVGTLTLVPNESTSTKLVFKLPAGKSVAGLSVLSNVQGISYSVDNTNAHPIRKIISKSGSPNATFKPYNTANANIKPWSWGSAPDTKSGSSVNQDTSSSTTNTKKTDNSKVGI